MSVYLVMDHLSLGANNLRAFTEKVHHRNTFFKMVLKFQTSLRITSF